MNAVKSELELGVEALTCWVNCWADEDYDQPREYRRGYEDAVSDILTHLIALAPNWLDSWRSGVREPLV